MRKIHLLCTLFLGLITNGLQAQKNYLPGTLTLNSGESLTGYIEYRNWSRTPTQIEFKRTPDAGAQTYTLTLLKGFEIKDADKFRKAVIWKEVEPGSFSALRYDSLPRRQDTVFLRSVVEASTLSLYEYTDERSHFYIQPAGDTLQELLNPSVYNTATGQFNTRAVYRDQLKLHAIGHPQRQQLYRKIEAAPYRETHFKAIVLQLAGEERVTYVTPEKAITSRQAFVAAGMIFSTTFSRDRASLVTPYKKQSFQLSGGVDFFSLKRFQNMFFRAELRAGTSSYQDEYWEADYRISQSTLHQYDVDYLYLNPAVHVLFPFLRTDNAQVYGGGGFSYTILKSTRYNHTMTNGTNGSVEEGSRDEYASVHGRGGTLLTLGWMYKRRIELKVFRNLGGMIIPDVQSKYNGVFIGYRF